MLEIYRISFFGRMALYACAFPIKTRDIHQSFQIDRIRRSIFLEKGDLETLLNSQNYQNGLREIFSRFQAGSELWIVKDDKAIIGFGWTIRGKTIEPYFFPLHPNDLHFYDFFVFHDHRGFGINVALVQNILMEMSSEGIRQAFIECAAWNHSQQRSLSKTPFSKYAEATKIPFWGRTIVLWNKKNNNN